MNKLYFSQLDTLRFIAFFLVFWQHGFSASFSNISDNLIIQTIIDSITITGGIGVHIFFILSGFLITLLLIKEQELYNKIDIGKFFIRRFLRIWPLYYLIMVLGIFILPYLINTFDSGSNSLMNLFFLNNFNMQSSPPNINIAWSVAIEEQFYLIWPFVFILFKNKNKLIILAVLLFFISVGFKIIFPELSYFHTIANINYLMVGCIGAILFSNNQINKMGFYQRFILIKKRFVVLLILTITILAHFFLASKYISYFVLPWLFLLIILQLANSEESRKISRISVLGKYTYGMYLYHPLILIILKVLFDLLKIEYNNSILNNLILATLGLSVTILISIISYNYYERYFLKIKEKYAKIQTRS